MDFDADASDLHGAYVLHPLDQAGRAYLQEVVFDEDLGLIRFLAPRFARQGRIYAIAPPNMPVWWHSKWDCRTGTPPARG